MNNKEKEMLMTIIENNLNTKYKEKLVRKYDFKSPQKFSKDHIRALERIFENFSRIASNYFSRQLSRNVKIHVNKITQISYQQYINGIVSPPVLSLISMKPIEGTIMIDINPVFAYKILEMLLGGKGGNQIIPKEFSEIDKKVISKIIDGLCPYLKNAWSEYLDIEPVYETLQTNFLGNQLLASNEPVALIKLSVEYDKEETYINICIPYLCLENHLDKLELDTFYSGKKEHVDCTDKVKEKMKSVEVDLKVELGTTKLMVNDFLKLANGDVIILKNNTTEPSIIYIEDIPCFYCKSGKINTKKAVQILDIIIKEE